LLVQALCRIERHRLRQHHRRLEAATRRLSGFRYPGVRGQGQPAEPFAPDRWGFALPPPGTLELAVLELETKGENAGGTAEYAKFALRSPVERVLIV
jgi:hypothetical protein